MMIDEHESDTHDKISYENYYDDDTRGICNSDSYLAAWRPPAPN